MHNDRFLDPNKMFPWVQKLVQFFDTTSSAPWGSTVGKENDLQKFCMLK